MLGTKLFILGCKVQNTTNLIKVVTPFLQRLSQNTNETINFAILEGREAIYLFKIGSKEMLKAGIEVGTKVAAHCASLGKVLLAFLPEQEFIMLYPNENEKLPTFTPKSISSVEELKKCLKKIKKQGYALDKNEYIEGSNYIAVPIIEYNNQVNYALSISIPHVRLKSYNSSEITDDLLKSAKAILEMIK
jgi:DNA-binding IclR family transcriptional regulator